MVDYLVQHVCHGSVLEYVVSQEGYQELHQRMYSPKPITIQNRKGQTGELWLTEGETLMILPLAEEEHEPTTDRQEKTKPITLREGKGQNSIPPSQREGAAR